MNNTLITGACGYIGKALIRELKSENLFSLDRRYDKEINQRSHRLFCDDLNELSNDTKSFLNNFSGRVIHLAAARSDDSFEEMYANDNVNATQKFIEKLNPKQIKLFIHIGSVAAIDGKNLDQKNKTIASSDDWYRVSKYRQQQLIESWAINNNVPVIILAPSAIYDDDASQNSTNIGRLEKTVKFFKIIPEINVMKSLTSMPSFINVIKYFLDIKIEKIHYDNTILINRYLVIDRPVTTVTEICKSKFKARLVIKIPKLKNILTILSGMITFLGLQKIIPLSKDRVIKLYKNTDYKNIDGYKEWLDEKA